MAYIPMTIGNADDVVSFFENAASFQTNNSSSTNSITAEVGEKYLLCAIRYTSSGTASDAAIASGATVDKVLVNNIATSTPRVKLYIVLCTATSNVIEMAGTGNMVSACKLRTGGSKFDIDPSLAPDAFYAGTLAYGGTATLTVTQKPKYIVYALANTATAGDFLTGIINVEEGTAYRYGYWTSAFRNEAWSNYSTYVTSITDSSVVIKNNYGAQARIEVAVFY